MHYNNFASSPSPETWEQPSFATGMADYAEIYAADAGNFADMHPGRQPGPTCYEALWNGSFATGQDAFSTP